MKPDKAICNYYEHGPYFGDLELAANSEPFNESLNCTSMEKVNIYRIDKIGRNNALTNKDSCAFTITELEVWEVIEEQE
jgi:hypothetical protein